MLKIFVFSVLVLCVSSLSIHELKKLALKQFKYLKYDAQTNPTANCITNSPWKEFIRTASKKYPSAKGKELYGYITDEMDEKTNALSSSIVMYNQTYLTMTSVGLGKMSQIIEAVSNPDKYLKKCTSMNGYFQMGYVVKPTRFLKSAKLNLKRKMIRYPVLTNETDCMVDEKWKRVIDFSLQKSPKTMSMFIHGLKEGLIRMSNSQFVMVMTMFGNDPYNLNTGWNYEGEGTYDEWATLEQRMNYCTTVHEFVGYAVSLALGTVRN